MPGLTRSKASHDTADSGGAAVQLKELGGGGGGAQNTLGNAAVQRRMGGSGGGDEGGAKNAGQVRGAASSGTRGGGGKMPHADKIQEAFGKHDISDARAHTGADANQACADMGAAGYATGSDVAFGEGNPSLETAAHEAAHVVQQQSGVSLAGGVGRAGDQHEKQADDVAKAVVSGGDAESILDKTSGGQGSSAGGGASSGPVQQEPVTAMAIAALVVSIVSALTGVAALAQGVAAAQNNQRSGGASQRLAFGGKYFLTSLGEAVLRNIAEACLKKHLDIMEPNWQTRDDVTKTTQAKAAAELEIQQYMARRSGYVTSEMHYWWGNDSRSSSVQIPGGWVNTTVNGGKFTGNSISGVSAAAARHGIGQMDAEVEFLESVEAEGSGYTSPGMIEDDFCYVRPATYEATQIGGKIGVTGKAYFDWDSNTTYMDWLGGNAISLASVPRPNYQDGPPDT